MQKSRRKGNERKMQRKSYRVLNQNEPEWKSRQLCSWRMPFPSPEEWGKTSICAEKNEQHWLCVHKRSIVMNDFALCASNWHQFKHFIVLFTSLLFKWNGENFKCAKATRKSEWKRDRAREEKTTWTMQKRTSKSFDLPKGKHIPNTRLFDLVWSMLCMCEFVENKMNAFGWTLYVLSNYFRWRWLQFEHFELNSFACSRMTTMEKAKTNLPLPFFVVVVLFALFLFSLTLSYFRRSNRRRHSTKECCAHETINSKCRALEQTNWPSVVTSTLVATIFSCSRFNSAKEWIGNAL